MTYLAMSVPFAVAALAVFAAGSVRAARRGRARLSALAWAATCAVLVALTIVFDNVMIAAGLFDFGGAHITGVRIGLMPIEDLLYPVVGSLLLCGAREFSSDRKVSRA